MNKTLLTCAISLAFIAGACGGDEPTPSTPGGTGSSNTETPAEPSNSDPEPSVGAPEGKEVYIPQELRNMDLTNPESKWCWKRSRATDDVILFWAKGFGDDLSKAPALQGHDMRVDADNLLNKVQQFYDYYRNELKFVEENSMADRFRMMVMLDYSLEGTAYGGTYDNVIGALWVAPNRVQDKNMNAVAHELGHSFQLQIIADHKGDAWGGCGFYEMTSQWMLWQVNPEWTSDEYYHLEEFRKLTHKAYLHIDNIYHSPYVIEFWAEKHGLPFIAELYREGRRNEDPVITYKRVTGIDQEEFNDEMWRNYARLVNFDIDRVRPYTRNLSSAWKTALTDAGDGWKRVAKSNAPENYGFNIIPITPPSPDKVKVEFRGEAGYEGYVGYKVSEAGWRYGFVVVDDEDNLIYTDPASNVEGSISFTMTQGRTIKKLWLVVMGAPKTHWKNDDSGNIKDAQWPYSFRVLSL